MEQVTKGAIPDFFSQFVAKKEPKTWEDISSIRKELREHILQEQGNCCAYTEVRLESEDNCHISFIPANSSLIDELSDVMK